MQTLRETQLEIWLKEPFSAVSGIKWNYTISNVKLQEIIKFCACKQESGQGHACLGELVRDHNPGFYREFKLFSRNEVTLAGANIFRALHPAKTPFSVLVKTATEVSFRNSYVDVTCVCHHTRYGKTTAQDTVRASRRRRLTVCSYGFGTSSSTLQYSPTTLVLW